MVHELEEPEALIDAVGADFGVFGDGDIVSATFAEAGDVDGLVEAAELAAMAIKRKKIIKRFIAHKH
jgi:hypothetical protein